METTMTYTKEAGKYYKDNPEKVRKEIIKLEDEMYKYAKNLEFEEAATYRDRVEELKKQLLLS